MENHFHAVVHADNLPRIMADLKKFTAGKLLAQFREERRTWLLDLFSAGKAEHRTAGTWQLWQEGYHPRAIYSDQTMQQKIDYIHAKPAAPGLGGCSRALALQLRSRMARRQCSRHPV
jgi:putative transposase